MLYRSSDLYLLLFVESDVSNSKHFNCLPSVDISVVCYHNIPSTFIPYIPMILLYIWDIKQILKKFPPDKINDTKNTLFFLSRAPTHHCFTFYLRFLYELKYMVHLDSILFLLKFIFLSTKYKDLLTLKHHNSF